MTLDDDYLELVEELIDIANEHSKTPKMEGSGAVGTQKGTREQYQNSLDASNASQKTSSNIAKKPKHRVLNPQQKALIYSEIFNRKY